MLFCYKSIQKDQIGLKCKILVSAYAFSKKTYQNSEIHWTIQIFFSDFYCLSRFCVTSLVILNLNLHRNGKKSKIKQQKGQQPLNYKQSDSFYESVWRLQGYIHVNMLKNSLFWQKFSWFNQISKLGGS